MDNGYIRMWSDLKYVCQYPDPLVYPVLTIYYHGSLSYQ